MGIFTCFRICFETKKEGWWGGIGVSSSVRVREGAGKVTGVG